MSSAPRTLRRPASEDSLQIVRRRSRKLIKRQSPRRVAPVAIIAVILSAAIVGGVLLEQVVSAQTAFRLSRLTEATQKAQAKNGELLLKASRLGSPARIERYARTRLGMVDPANLQYIIANVRSRAGAAIARSAPATDSAPAGPAVAAPISGGAP
ncbi:MAG: Cell division protein FtsL [Actinomycetota bacterium]|jgi:cell division protein FtsL|nr:Cell division protein FtsL [Actinomycetota bacterium]